MSIQQDINSALGQVGILASLNPSLQQRAHDKEELGKIKAQEKTLSDRAEIVGEEMNKTGKSMVDFLKDVAKMSPEEQESKAVQESMDKMRKEALSQRAELDDLQKKAEELVRRGYGISPKEYRDRYFAVRQQEVQREIDSRVAAKANEDAQKAAQEKALIKEKRKQYMSNLYKGVNRTLPGFKDMSREQQESIVKKMSPSERRKIANEEKWRSEIYGK